MPAAAQENQVTHRVFFTRPMILDVLLFCHVIGQPDSVRLVAAFQLLELNHKRCESLSGKRMFHHSGKYLIGNRDGVSAGQNHVDHLLDVLDGGADDHGLVDSPGQS